MGTVRNEIESGELRSSYRMEKFFWEWYASLNQGTLPIYSVQVCMPIEDIDKFDVASEEEREKMGEPTWIEVGFLEGCGWMLIRWKHKVEVIKKLGGLENPYDSVESMQPFSCYENLREVVEDNHPHWLEEMDKVVEGKERKGYWYGKESPLLKELRKEILEMEDGGDAL